MNRTSKEDKRNKQIVKWEKTRKLGMVKYILLHGVFYWGLPMALFLTAFNYKILNQGTLKAQLSINIPLFILGGALFGFLTWRTYEGLYKRYMAKHNPPQPGAATEADVDDESGENGEE